MPQDYANPAIPFDQASERHPDPHGQAALLLTESLIHALVDKKVLTLREVVEIVEIATDVEREIAAATDGGTPLRLQKSLLAPLAHSLKSDLG